MKLMDKFKKGDKVVKIGTNTPVMTIFGKTTKVNKGTFNSYQKETNLWTCKWIENTVINHSAEIPESELELFSNTNNI